MVATIDSDISNLSANEFAPVFMGGIAVMFGGLLSVLFVGYIVNSQDLSARIVADSYAQSENDEAFWQGLSDEEKKKTQALLQRVKESKGGTKKLAPPPIEQEPASSESIVEAVLTQKTSVEREKTKVGMFDDYGE
jgi:hypothetical protein